MNRYYPTLKEIIYTALTIIHNHPNIKKPIVTYPIPNSDGSFTPVPIDKYRAYDGLELIEPGLTLSIFPKYTSTPESGNNSSTAKFNPYTLGNKDAGFMYEVTYRLVIDLVYQDIALNNDKQLLYVRDKFNNVSPYQETLRDQTQDPFVEEHGLLNLEVNPAEDILRDYLEVIRLIIESIDYYAPWSIRSSSIISFDFPTSSWSNDSKNIYFHKAFMVWELGTYAPSTLETPTSIRNLILYRA